MLRLQVGLDKKETQTTTLTRENPGFWTGRGSVFQLCRLHSAPRLDGRRCRCRVLLQSLDCWAALLGSSFWLLCWELWGVLLLWLLLPVLLWLEDATIPSCWNVNWGFKNSFSNTSHQRSTHRLATKSIFIPVFNHNHP